jgi:hypothetical protein
MKRQFSSCIESARQLSGDEMVFGSLPQISNLFGDKAPNAVIPGWWNPLLSRAGDSH